MIEDISHKKELLARIIRHKYLKKKGINFFTPHYFPQQIAYMNHPKNHSIQSHIHKKKLKKVNSTTEVLIILKGSLKINFFDKKKIFLKSKKLNKNDIIILLSGGHGFKIQKKCSFIEVKQGPYNIKQDKLKF